MTTPNLPDFSDPEYETLPIYTVAETLALETGKRIGLWLWRIACSACTQEEPAHDSNSPSLILRPDEKWGIPKSKRENVYQPRTPGWINSRLTYPDHSRISHSRLVEYRTLWNLQESILNRFLSNFNTPPVDDRAFQGIDISLHKEGVCLYRNDFQKWCEASGYALPRFWFGDEAPKPSPADQMKQLKESARKEAEDYAISERKKGSPFHEIIRHIEDEYIDFAFEGQTLHDIIWPEKALTRSDTHKRKVLSDHRKKV